MLENNFNHPNKKETKKGNNLSSLIAPVMASLMAVSACSLPESAADKNNNQPTPVNTQPTESPAPTPTATATETPKPALCKTYEGELKITPITTDFDKNIQARFEINQRTLWIRVVSQDKSLPDTWFYANNNNGIEQTKQIIKETCIVNGRPYSNQMQFLDADVNNSRYAVQALNSLNQQGIYQGQTLGVAFFLVVVEQTATNQNSNPEQTPETKTEPNSQPNTEQNQFQAIDINGLVAGDADKNLLIQRYPLIIIIAAENPTQPDQVYTSLTTDFEKNKQIMKNLVFEGGKVASFTTEVDNVTNQPTEKPAVLEQINGRERDMITLMFANQASGKYVYTDTLGNKHLVRIVNR